MVGAPGLAPHAAPRCCSPFAMTPQRGAVGEIPLVSSLLGSFYAIALEALAKSSGALYAEGGVEQGPRHLGGHSPGWPGS
eukprot:691849-Pyramimonas_sp.AAC.1